MNNLLEKQIADKINLLNTQGKAVIFVVTGGNGTGKSVIAKNLLTHLPFHQSFNLGAITKTIRFLNEDLTVSQLENFTDKNIDNLFTPIVQYSCQEYQKNGVNVIVDGVQINTRSQEWYGLVTGGVILTVERDIKLQRNDFPDTHFKRKIDIQITDQYRYEANDLFLAVDNSSTFVETYNDVLRTLDQLLTSQIETISDKKIGALK